jgi:hypothetical protein
VGDVYFPQTEMLLPFNGINGATATGDLSNLNNAVTFGGNASISTARSKFGGSSCHFDGTGDYVDVGGTYWTTGAAIDSGDFTIEFWLNIDAWGGNSNQSPINNYGDGNGGWGFYVSTSTGKVYWWFYNGSGWVYVNSSTGTRTALSLDTWYHIALTRSGNIFRLFLDGTQEDSTTDSNAMTSSTGSVQSGIRLGAIDTDYPVNGYIDDVRISKGIARYTSNFTAPTTAHSTSAGDVNKQVLINSTADGVAIGTGGINQARISKAWVEFDGSGITINASYNVSSITDHGNRDYTINFSTAMADAYYSIVGSNIGQTSTYSWSVVTGMGTAKTASAARINVPHINDSSLYGNDANTVNVIVFGN